MDFRKLNPKIVQFGLLLVVLIVCLFISEFIRSETNAEIKSKTPKFITGQFEVKESQKPVPQQKVDSDWYNPRNRIVTVGTLDTFFREDAILYKENPCDSTKLALQLTLKRYVELGSQNLVPLPGEPIDSEVSKMSLDDKERVQDLQNLRAMLFWGVIFAKENKLLNDEACFNYLNLCPAVILTAVLMDPNYSYIMENEDILKSAIRTSTNGRFVYECSVVLEHYDKLKGLWWYPPMAESAVQTLLERSPERLILLKQQVLEIKGGKEALASAQKLLAMR